MNTKEIIIDGIQTLSLLFEDNVEEKFLFTLKENSNLDLKVLCLCKNNQQQIAFEVKQYKNSISNIAIKLVGLSGEQNIKMAVHLEEEGCYSNNKQRNIGLSSKVRQIGSPIIYSKGENNNAIHGVSSGWLNLEEIFMLNLRGIEKDEAYKILLKKEMDFMQDTEHKEKIDDFINAIDWKGL